MVKEKVKFLAQIILIVERASLPRGLMIDYMDGQYKLTSQRSCYISEKWQKEKEELFQLRKGL